MIRRTLSIVLGAALALCAAGCQKSSTKQETAESGQAVPAASAVGALDNRVAQALAEVTESQQAPTPGDSGPPASGVFTQPAADLEHAPGAPSELTLGSSGTEPRLTLGAERGAALRGRLDVLATTGPSSALPRLQITVERRAEPSSGGSAPDGTPLDAASRATFLEVAPAADQPGQLPAELAAQIAKLSGSWLSASRTATGALRGGSETLSPAADVCLKLLFQRALEAYRHFDLHLPSEPVGQGAFWLVRSREAFGDTQGITYRMYRVTSVEGDKASLEVNIRRYAVGPTTQIADIPAHQLTQYSAEGSGELSVLSGSTWPLMGKVSERVQMLITTGDDPRPRILQSEIQATFTRATP